MGAAGMAFRLYFFAATCVLEIGANVFWFSTGRLGKRIAGCISVDNPRSRHCALHHGPVPQYAVLLYGDSALDCAGDGTTEILAGLFLDCAGRGLASFDGRIRDGFCAAVDLAAKRALVVSGRSDGGCAVSILPSCDWPLSPES